MGPSGSGRGWGWGRAISIYRNLTVLHLMKLFVAWSVVRINSMLTYWSLMAEFSTYDSISWTTEFRASMPLLSSVSAKNDFDREHAAPIAVTFRWRWCNCLKIRRSPSKSSSSEVSAVINAVISLCENTEITRYKYKNQFILMGTMIDSKSLPLGASVKPNGFPSLLFKL